MRRWTIGVVAFSALVLLPQPADAGGWWTSSDVHDQPLAVGESLRVRVGEVLFRTIKDAQRAETTPYFAYLVTAYNERLLDRAMRRDDPKRWWEPLSPAIQVGKVTLTDRDSNLQRGRVHLEVPDIPPGRYFFMLCDAGCQEPLGNHIPVPVHITTDVVAARAARRLERMDERLDIRFARLRQDVRQATRAARDAQHDSSEAADAIARLATRADAKPAAASSNPPLRWLSYAGWFVAGTCAGFMIRRYRRQPMVDDVVIDHVPDDARELLKTPL
ncbi:MAG: hypothetical protein M3161_07020 [Actinomycetota bacterium]|nr:hypothetical protein [Actinomycetota bacterium]